jgi:hypothetical protein
MRNETPCLWGIDPDQTHLTYGAFRAWKGSLSSGQALRRGSFAVEMCWLSDGVVTCRTYQVRATSEVQAARLACQCASKAMGSRISRIEAVDVEPLQRGDRHA